MSRRCPPHNSCTLGVLQQASRSPAGTRCTPPGRAGSHSTPLPHSTRGCTCSWQPHLRSRRLQHTPCTPRSRRPSTCRPGKCGTRLSGDLNRRRPPPPIHRRCSCQPPRTRTRRRRPGMARSRKASSSRARTACTQPPPPRCQPRGRTPRRTCS